MSIFLYMNIAGEQTTLLIKIPTRSRPHQFFKNLDTFYQKLSHRIPYIFLITCDSNDESMNNPVVIKRLQCYPNLYFSFSDNQSKVDAFNKDIEQFDFEVLLLAHDDMTACAKNFDQIIMNAMREYFPDLDGVLNFDDGHVGGQCNTLPVIGRHYYERFGYAYNPCYKALVCNVELTVVSKILNKEKVLDQVIITHNHPAWGTGLMDNLYKNNETFHEEDKQTFCNRREIFFDLTEDEIKKATPRIWSILICTIEEREESYNKLCNKLKEQINLLGLQDAIEILSCKDKKGENTIGFKRNALLAESRGEYISYIDDDDDIHDNFIQMIYEALLKKPDCVSLMGIITTNGTDPKTFIHSIAYNHYFEENDIYFRPPNHLNPIKRSIAVQFSFPEKNFGEDTDWAMAVQQSGLLQQEILIETPYYFYDYQTNK